MTKITSLKKVLGISALIISVILPSTISAAEQCIKPNAPVIPDGNLASQSEMVDTANAFKVFQTDLGEYHLCVQEKSLKLKGKTKKSKAKKEALIAQYDKAVILEEETAAKFNAALKAFKSK